MQGVGVKKLKTFRVRRHLRDCIKTDRQVPDAAVHQLLQASQSRQIFGQSLEMNARGHFTPQVPNSA